MTAKLHNMSPKWKCWLPEPMALSLYQTTLMEGLIQDYANFVLFSCYVETTLTRFQGGNHSLGGDKHSNLTVNSIEDLSALQCAYTFPLSPTQTAEMSLGCYENDVVRCRDQSESHFMYGCHQEHGHYTLIQKKLLMVLEFFVPAVPVLEPPRAYYTVFEGLYYGVLGVVPLDILRTWKGFDKAAVKY